MTFQEFKKIIAKGETASVDFKLSCNAFDKGCGDHEKAKAELVKNICAMANNGPTVSYLIVGVSDDRKQFQSVLNTKLISANIQTLIRDSIHPHPRVKVSERYWSKAPQPLGQKRFIIIQIGPNAKDAYRFNRDYVQSGSGYNFRKNQVWVRNQDTSDIATPEQIVRLKTKRSAQQADEEAVQGIDYEKLAESEKAKAMCKDLRQVFREHDFRVLPINKAKRGWPSASDYDFRVVGKLNNKAFLFLCGTRTTFSKSHTQSFELHQSWKSEHAFVFILQDNIGKMRKKWIFDQPSVNYSMPWGSYSLFPSQKLSWSHFYGVSKHQRHLMNQPLVSFITIPRVSHTSILREKVSAMLNSLESDPQTFAHLQMGRHNLETLRKEVRKIPWRGLKKSPGLREGALDALKYLRQNRQY